jgi:hypothetical protein
MNKLVLIGNGFDLAHGLKTSYRNFLDWYMCKAFQEFVRSGSYEDRLIHIRKKYAGMQTMYNAAPSNFEEVLNFLKANEYQSIEYKSKFYRSLLNLCSKGWVDIEYQYFHWLKSLFINSGSDEDRIKNARALNLEFDYIVELLTEYITEINAQLSGCSPLPLGDNRHGIFKAFTSEGSGSVTVLNFNYTDTLQQLGYVNGADIIHIHGRASAVLAYPIILGYGDETDPVYQKIEDSGVNEYLQHIKSFGYFKTYAYNRLIDLIDSNHFKVYIIGHSCGLSDRILLNEIFEHRYCDSIEVFHHQRNGSDNFKETTQQISRHFRPQNKNLMRRRIKPYNRENTIPQNPC